jgi:hypothetical protein
MRVSSLRASEGLGSITYGVLVSHFLFDLGGKVFAKVVAESLHINYFAILASEAAFDSVGF